MDTQSPHLLRAWVYLHWIILGIIIRESLFSQPNQSSFRDKTSFSYSIAPLPLILLWKQELNFIYQLKKVLVTSPKALSLLMFPTPAKSLKESREQWLLHFSLLGPEIMSLSCCPFTCIMPTDFTGSLMVCKCPEITCIILKIMRTKGHLFFFKT